MKNLEKEYMASLAFLPFSSVQGTGMETDWFEVQDGTYEDPSAKLADTVVVESQTPRIVEAQETPPEHPQHIPVIQTSLTSLIKIGR